MRIEPGTVPPPPVPPRTQPIDARRAELLRLIAPETPGTAPAAEHPDKGRLLDIRC